MKHLTPEQLDQIDRAIEDYESSLTEEELAELLEDENS